MRRLVARGVCTISFFPRSALGGDVVGIALRALPAVVVSNGTPFQEPEQEHQVLVAEVGVGAVGVHETVEPSSIGTVSGGRRNTRRKCTNPTLKAPC